MISAKVIADSMSPHGKRLTTLQLEYPRFIHSEIMTYRVFSRNAASSRAIPVKRLLARVREDPAMPLSWGKNQPGMQAKEQLDPDRIEACRKRILEARDFMADVVQDLQDWGLHKQTANRYLEPWMWMGVVLTATEWGNMFNQRTDGDAQPEFHDLADRAMLNAMNESEPQLQTFDDWHHPYVSTEEWVELGKDRGLKVSTARCARVSYLNHDGKKAPFEEDELLCERLAKAPHPSPFEHCASPASGPDVQSGNFFGWHQYRKFLLPNENRPDFPRLLNKWKGA